MPKVKKEDNVLYAGADEWVNTRTGQVITADYNQVCYSNDARPIDAPMKNICKYWKTIENPKGYSFKNEFEY